MLANGIFVVTLCLLNLQLFTRWFLINCYCLLYVTRYKAHGTSSFPLINVRCSWIAVAYCVLYIHLHACYFRWRYSLPAVRWTMFALCCCFFVLYTTCYSLLLCCSLPTYCSALTSRCLIVLSRCLPLVAHRPTVQCFLHANGFYLVAANGSPRLTARFFGFFTRRRSFMFFSEA